MIAELPSPTARMHISLGDDMADYGWTAEEALGHAVRDALRHGFAVCEIGGSDDCPTISLRPLALLDD